MKALFFGSIGTLLDSSELQRAAFNTAFAAHGLDWHWARDAYREMLRAAGGAERVAAYAEARGEVVDVARIHQSKSQIFQTALRGAALPLRAGVAETLVQARAAGLGLAWVTTTSRANMDAVLEAVSGTLDAGLFDAQVSRNDVVHAKPAPDAYQVALRQLDLRPSDVVAVEDNADGVRAASAAGIPVIAFPNANVRGHDFSPAFDVQTGALRVPDLPERVESAA